jgi:TPR repeat protein
MYHIGQGVEDDLEEAIKWYKKAAAQGHKDAQLSLERISAFHKTTNKR